MHNSKGKSGDTPEKEGCGLSAPAHSAPADPQWLPRQDGAGTVWCKEPPACHAWDGCSKREREVVTDPGSAHASDVFGNFLLSVVSGHLHLKGENFQLAVCISSH